MGRTKIRKGLNLPIIGAPQQTIQAGRNVHHVALVGPDYVGMKPTLLVNPGDTVKLGQPIFSDKKIPRVQYCAPGSGTVTAIHRGAKRAFLSMIIELKGDEAVEFPKYAFNDLAGLRREQVVEALISSGEWPLLRQRPFSKVADPDQTPAAIFVTAMDSNPLAPDVSKILEGQGENFRAGLTAIGKLTEGPVYLCKASGAAIPGEDVAGITVEEFEGPHPAGLVGTHIHFLHPAGRGKVVWYINAQDVVAVGSLLLNGRIHTGRVVALGGPGVKQPRLLKTRVGASLADLVKDELNDGDNRVISGSVFSGRAMDEQVGFLGRFHQQISVISEGRKKEFIGWMMPGFNKYSVKNLVASKLTPGKKFSFSTAINGGHRAIVPIGAYEQVMPLDIIATYLLRAIAVDDVEDVEKLGGLELDEEDLALCTFVCPSKQDYGPMLRRNLTIIEKEG